MKEVNLGDLGVFAEALTEIEIKKVDVPSFLRIPNWPFAAGGVALNLGERECIVPVKSDNTSMLRLEQDTREVNFVLHQTGLFSFRLVKFAPNFFGKGKHEADSDTYNTDSDHVNTRIRAVVLFHQFQEEICTKLIEKLKADIPEHDKTMEMVEKAMAPFIPFLVADALDT